MEIERALPQESSVLSHRMRVVAANQHGLGRGQLRFIGTDPELFEAFYREQVEDLQRFVARRVGDRERAADLTAEIFLAAIDSAHRYRPALGTPRAWLLGIARFLVAGDHRRQDRRLTGEERLRGSALLDQDDAARWDARIDAASRSRELHRAMDRLPDGERAILELVALDELSVAEAAAAAGVRAVTARVRLHRARRTLRAELAAAADQPDPRKEDRR
jgi:RNA polymerase sigma factor (sigma-70 family)